MPAGASLTFRAAQAADAGAIAALVNAAYRVGGARAWTTEAHLVDGARVTTAELGEILSRPGHAVLVARSGDRLVGAVHLERAADDEVLLGMLSVDPDLQAGGVGRQLLAHAEEHARVEMRARAVVLHVVSVRAELIAWYERRGYRRTGDRVPFAGRGSERLLEGPLEFAKLRKALAA